MKLADESLGCFHHGTTRKGEIGLSDTLVRRMFAGQQHGEVRVRGLHVVIPDLAGAAVG